MSEPQQPEQDKREENWVVVVDQTSLHRRGVESKPSTPANEPRTPWLPAVKSKHSETKYTSKPDTKGQLKRSETSQEELPVVPSDIQEKKATPKAEQLEQLMPEQPETLETKRLEATVQEQQAAEQNKTPAEKNKPKLDAKEAEESSNDKITELRTQNKFSDWSDEEEAGGLSRTESRASRVSRAVRQLFCCGVPYEPPEEDNISCHRAYAI